MFRDHSHGYEADGGQGSAGRKEGGTPAGTPSQQFRPEAMAETEMLVGPELTGPCDGWGRGSVGLILRGLRCFGLYLCRQ